MVFSLNKVESSCRVSCETLFLALRRIKVDGMKSIHSVGKLEAYSAVGKTHLHQQMENQKEHVI